jgi:hypothetical protein
MALDLLVSVGLHVLLDQASLWIVGLVRRRFLFVFVNIGISV